MLLIVAHHYVVNSGLLAADGPIYATIFSWRSIFLILFGAWGKTGINCFVLITGYFMCRSNITSKKFFKILFELLFYHIVIYIIFLCTGYESFSFNAILTVLFPFQNVESNFTGCYLIFFLFIPFLNILIKNINERQHICLLALCVAVYVVLGTLPFCSVKMNYISWFIVLYFLGAYIRIYNRKWSNSCKLWGWMTLGLLVIAVASIFMIIWWKGKTGSDISIYYFVSDSNKIFAVALAVSSFLYFKNLKMKNNRIINMIAASCFGVLCIHANSNAMRQWLWCDLLNNVNMYNSAWLIPHAIGCVFAIYFICTAIDFLRIRFLERPFLNWWDKLWQRAISKFLRKNQKVKEDIDQSEMRLDEEVHKTQKID